MAYSGRSSRRRDVAVYTVIGRIFSGKEVAFTSFLTTFLWILTKFIALVLLAFTLVKKIRLICLPKFPRQDHGKLFTICVLAVIFMIAVGAS